MNAFARATNGQGERCFFLPCFAGSGRRNGSGREASETIDISSAFALHCSVLADLPDEQWEELTTYLDVNDDTELTFKGFTALYSLQTGQSAE